MANRIGGILYLTIDGAQYAVRGSFTVTPSTVKREGIAGQTAVDGYTEMPVVPGCKGDLSTVPGLSLTALEAITDSTLTVALANGTTYVLAGAFSLPPFEVDTAEGKVGVAFGCVTCDELVASS
jgi:hypothetical protein